MVFFVVFFLRIGLVFGGPAARVLVDGFWGKLAVSEPNCRNGKNEKRSKGVRLRKQDWGSATITDFGLDDKDDLRVCMAGRRHR